MLPVLVDFIKEGADWGNCNSFSNTLFKNTESTKMGRSGYKIVSLKITTSKALIHAFHSTYLCRKYPSV
jgi:hypothetical protein